MFWHPIALSKSLANGKTLLITVLGEEFTLYRGDSGKAFLVGGHCRHRQTLLHTGWVEGDRIRCMYHGWTYDGTGACVERPAEKEKNVPASCKIPGHAVHEYCGLIFAYIGEGEAPSFDLPRKDALEAEGVVVVATQESWGINWFQQIENSLDATHVSFVHRALRVASFGEAVTNAIPDLSYEETEAGIEQTARRADMDMNGHINNVTYLAWAMETVPRDVWEGGAHLYQAEIDFRSECHAGDLIESIAGWGELSAVLAGNGAGPKALTFVHTLRKCQGEACTELVRARTTWRVGEPL
jgi:phenylpropionate dioxygenase-like ring-hydroxylating dioxygenase large terminal subunit